MCLSETYAVAQHRDGLPGLGRAVEVDIGHDQLRIGRGGGNDLTRCRRNQAATDAGGRLRGDLVARVGLIDGGDDAETFEITKTQGQQLDKLDEKTPEQILAGMPENSRKAAEATLDTQMKTQGKDKIAQLKDDPKVSAQVEEMDLDPVGSFRDEAKVAPIRTPKDEPPMMVPDENAEKMAKEAAIRQMQESGGEAMLAS